MSHSTLIVDDSPIIRSVLTRCLKISGYTENDIRTATNGAEALDSIKSNIPELLLCDLHMPQMTGMELIKELHDQDILDKVTTIIISSDRSQERRDDLKKLGVESFLNKPFTPDGVVQCINQAKDLTA